MPTSLRHAWRRIVRAPGYALAFVLTLGLGIGINTAIFSVVNGVLLAPLPYANADRLVHVTQPAAGAGFTDVGFSFTEIADLKRDVRTLDAFVEYGDLTFNVVGEGDPHRAVGGIVTSNYFDVLGLRAQLGRTLRPDDDGVGPQPVMVLTDGYWRRAFGADTSVLGRVLRLYVFSEPKEVQVVGVLRPGVLYTGTRQQDFFVNYASSNHYGGAAMLDERTHRMTDVFARLAPGATARAAQQELSAAHARLRDVNPAAYPENLGLDIAVAPWREALTSEARPMLLILSGTVALVLLLACANVANLTLTRLVRRERELAVQAALGAPARRIRADLLLENTLLAFGGAALGLLLAVVCRDLLIQYAGRFTVRTGEIAIDRTVLLATAGVAFAAALLLAWLPPLPTLLGGGGRRVVGMTRKRLQRGLVVGQLALCFTLLVGAGLLVRSLIGLSRVDPGLAYESVLALDVPNVTGLGGGQNRVLMDALTERTRGLPGVREVAYSSHVPFTDGMIMRLTIEVEGRDASTIATPEVAQSTVSPTYFETVGIRIVRGRGFDGTDREGSEPVVILNESLARTLFGDDDPLGRRVRQQQFNGQWGPWVQVVGIAADTREFGIVDGATHTYYRPSAQAFPGQSLVVRTTTADPASVVRHVQATVRELDPERPVDNIVTLTALRHEDLAPPRLNATLFSAFAALALVIAAVGVLGVLGFSVSQRTQEFGLRMALGARREEVLAMVLREGGLLVGVALAAGALGALALSRFLQGIVFGVGTADPATYVGVGLLLAAVALFAAWLPARRATRVDPVEALRAE